MCAFQHQAHWLCAGGRIQRSKNEAGGRLQHMKEDNAENHGCEAFEFSQRVPALPCLKEDHKQDPAILSIESRDEL